IVTVPAQSFCAPARAWVMAAARFMPGVCAVLVSSSLPFTTRTPSCRQSVFLVIASSIASAEASASSRTLPFLAHRRVGFACEPRRAGRRGLGRIGEPPQRPDRHRADQRRRIVEQRTDLGEEVRRAAIADGDEDVAQEAVAADALYRRAREALPEGGIVEPGELRQERRRGRIAGRKAGLARRPREFVPGADGEAIVAAVDAVADQRAQRGVDMPLVLYGERGDAASRVEAIGRGKGRCRAGIEAAPAGAAMIGLSGIRRQLQGEIDLAEKEPG